MLFLLLASSAHAQELPKKSAADSFDFEPKLMLNDLPDIPLPAPFTTASTTGAPSLDVVKLEADMEKAKKSAVWRERLSKSGVLSKLEAEQAALKVVRLVKDLESARLQAVTREVEEKRKRAAGELSKEALAEAETALATATTTASAAAARWDEAQRAAAELRVQRERKLLALGAGSRVAVKRAEAVLQSLPPRASP